jgi:hypothetical protein
MSNVKERRSAHLFQLVGMGQGTLSFSKEYPDPFFNF